MSLKFNDQSLAYILEKIRNKPVKHSHRAQQLDQKYIDEQINYSPRKTNYQLQNKNIQLRKQFKKLQRILNTKLQIKSKLQNTDNQIQLLKQKLRNVLNASQTLELSLTRMRGTERQKKNDKIIDQPHCCCRRYGKSKTQQFSLINNQNKVKNKTQIIENPNMPQSCKQSPVLIKASYSPQKKAIVKRQQKSIECNMGPSQKQLKSLQQKKKQLQKLQSIIENQTKVIKQYESNIGTQTNIGKIAKSTSLKLNSCLNTCASIGSIMKTKRNMKNNQ